MDLKSDFTVLSTQTGNYGAISGGGELGGFLAQRLESVVGYVLGTLLVSLAVLFALLLATDMMWFRHFEGLAANIRQRIEDLQPSVRPIAIGKDGDGPTYGTQLRSSQMVFCSVYWSCADSPLSRPPNPLSLYPPNGVVMSPSP